MTFGKPLTKEELDEVHRQMRNINKQLKDAISESFPAKNYKGNDVSYNKADTMMVIVGSYLPPSYWGAYEAHIAKAFEEGVFGDRESFCDETMK